MWLAVWATLAWARPDAAVSYAFEAQFLDLRRHDEALAEYGFSPVGSPFLPTHSVRGVLEWPSGLTAGLAMSTAFTTHRADGAVVPTTTTSTQSTAVLGASPGEIVRLTVDLGLGTVVHSVGSEVQGGALTYLGPLAQPRVAARLFDRQAVVELAAGWTLLRPVGRAHRNPLWEEPFARSLFHGPFIAVQSGMGTKEGS